MIGGTIVLAVVSGPAMLTGVGFTVLILIVTTNTKRPVQAALHATFKAGDARTSATMEMIDGAKVLSCDLE